MFNRIKVVTSLLLVLVLFGALQLISGGLFFSSLKSDKENFTVLQTIRQQQLLLSESRVDLLQARNSLNRVRILRRRKSLSSSMASSTARCRS